MKFYSGGLYGEDVEIIKPSNLLLTPSNADYRVTQDYVVEKIQGDPLDLKNLTITQKRTGQGFCHKRTANPICRLSILST